MRLNSKKWIAYTSLLSAALMLPPAVRAQRQAAASAVYVHDSGVAVEKLALAEKLERLKEWDRSADLYLEVARDFADRVIAVDGDAGRFVNVVRTVQSRLAKWPADGVAAFRSRFEAAAAAAVAAAGHDEAALRQVLIQYFPTDAAKAAALTLVDDELEAGYFATARDTAQQLIDQHPGLSDIDRAVFLLRIGTAAHLAGDDAAAKATLDAAQKQFGSAIVTWQGRDCSIADAAAASALTPTTRPAYPEDRWLTPMGDISRSRNATRLQFGGTRMGYRDVDATAPRGVLRSQLEGLQKQQELARPAGFSTGVFPVIDRGQLFFQDNARIYAIDLDSGEALPGWSQTYPQSGTYALPDAWPLPQGQPCQLTLTNDSVFATLGLMDYTAAMYANTITTHSTRLVSLDRLDGRPRWTVMSQQLPENLASLDFAGCPLVDETTVYVQAHGSHGTFDDAYLLAFDRMDGSLRWSCYLCSSNLGSPDVDPTSNPFPVATTIAAESGRLFVQTNNGVIACVASQGGGIVWLREYPRDAVVVDRNDPAIWATRRTVMLGPRRPWEHNSTIASGGKIFSMPDDTGSLLVFDQTDGSMLRRILLSDYDGARTLIGVIGDHAIVASGKRLFCIDWTKYPKTAAAGVAVANGDEPPERAREAIVWMTDLNRTDMPDDAIRGRGVIAGESVVIPTVRQMLRFSAAGGSLKQVFPVLPQDQWSEDQGPGNLLFVGEQMIIAGVTRSGLQRVSWYTDFEIARRRLEAAEAAAPKRIEPLLRSARALFTAGQATIAQAKLQAAMALAPAEASASRERSMIYAAAIDLARRAAADTHGDPAVAARFFDRALPYVEGDEQQVEYRLIRADYDKLRANPTGMISLYQQILAVPAWRNVNVLQGERCVTAGDLAAESIGGIRESASGSYDEIEQAAKTAFNDAQLSQTVDQLVEVARAFPNSSVVGRAYAAAGMQAQFAGDHRHAVQWLRLALMHTSETSDRLQLLQQMAQSYIQLPGEMPIASGRLRQAARLSPTAKVTAAFALPNGRNLSDLSFAEAARLLDAEAGQHGPPLPDCAVPSNVRSAGAVRKRVEPFKTIELNSLGSRVVSLLDSPDDAGRNDRLVGKTADGIIVLRPGDTKPLFAFAPLAHVIQSAWAGGSLALLEPKTLTVVSGDKGDLHWKMQLDDFPLPPRLSFAAANSLGGSFDDLDLNAAMGAAPAVPSLMRSRPLGMIAEESPEGAEIFSALVALPDRIVCATNRGRVLVFDLSDGKLLWQRRLNDRPIVRLLANEDFVAAQTRDAGTMPFVLDALDGQMLHGNESLLQVADFRVLSVALSPDGMLVVTGPATLVIKDLFEPGTLTQATFRFPPNSIAVTMYNPTDPQSVQIRGRHVYALTDGGMKLRVVSLDDGKAVMFNQAQSIDTGARAGASMVMLADDLHCYVANEKWVHGYDLARGSHWGDLDTPQVRDVALTAEYVIALAHPPTEDAETKTTDELQLFSRAADQGGAESGLIAYRYSLPKDFSVADWQMMDGGVYLLGSDHRLLWLAGTAGH